MTLPLFWLHGADKYKWIIFFFLGNWFWHGNRKKSHEFSIIATIINKPNSPISPLRSTLSNTEYETMRLFRKMNVKFPSWLKISLHILDKEKGITLWNSHYWRTWNRRSLDTENSAPVVYILKFVKGLDEKQCNDDINSRLN